MRSVHEVGFVHTEFSKHAGSCHAQCSRPGLEDRRDSNSMSSHSGALAALTNRQGSQGTMMNHV